MTYLSRNKGYEDQVKKNQVKEKYKKAFGYGEGGGGSDGPTLIDGANFDGKYGVYFDCYKKGRKTHLRMFVDKNGDGEYSGKNEFLAYSRKLNNECAKYCEDLEKGSLTMTYDIVKDYSEDSRKDNAKIKGPFVKEEKRCMLKYGMIQENVLEYSRAEN